MNKKEILEEMQEKLNISKQKAEALFREAREKGEIRLLINWKRIIDYSIIVMVIISGLFALLNILF
jgi:hypothetical protein